VGVEGVRLPVGPAARAVGSVNFHHAESCRRQDPAELSTVRTGPFDPDRLDGSEATDPVQQSAIALRGSQELPVGELSTELVDDGRVMGVGVGVDTGGDISFLGRSRGRTAQVDIDRAPRMSRTPDRFRPRYEGATRRHDEWEIDMKFLLLTKYADIEGVAPSTEWNPTEVTAHVDHLNAVNKKLAENVELVEVIIVSGPDLATIVTSNGIGAPVCTDGPFPGRGSYLPAYRWSTSNLRRGHTRLRRRFQRPRDLAGGPSPSRSRCAS
jgi:hypothetical protein